VVASLRAAVPKFCGLVRAQVMIDDN